jgi:hypothetical protein
VLSGNIDTVFSWESLAKSRIFGLIQNRMYSGVWNSEMEQDFRLIYVPSSWIAKRMHTVSARKLEFSNSTSFAFHDIANLIRSQRSNDLWRDQYKSGNISLDD